MSISDSAPPNHSTCKLVHTRAKLTEYKGQGKKISLCHELLRGSLKEKENQRQEEDLMALVM